MKLIQMQIEMFQEMMDNKGGQVAILYQDKLKEIGIN